MSTNYRWVNVTERRPKVVELKWVIQRADTRELVTTGYWRDRQWWPSMLNHGKGPLGGVTHWRDMRRPTSPGAETIDPDNPPSGGSAVTLPLDPPASLPALCDAFVLGARCTMQAIEAIADMVKGEVPHA